MCNVLLCSSLFQRFLRTDFVDLSSRLSTLISSAGISSYESSSSLRRLPHPPFLRCLLPSLSPPSFLHFCPKRAFLRPPSTRSCSFSLSLPLMRTLPSLVHPDLLFPDRTPFGGRLLLSSPATSQSHFTLPQTVGAEFFPRSFTRT